MEPKGRFVKLYYGYLSWVNYFVLDNYLWLNKSMEVLYALYGIGFNKKEI